jgi:hypothetical protein
VIVGQSIPCSTVEKTVLPADRRDDDSCPQAFGRKDVERNDTLFNGVSVAPIN